jgi:uncharacterized protein
MELHNSFVVPADLDTAWAALLDVERMAPCMPGATLDGIDGIDGNDFVGSVKVKLGPVSIVYAGKARFVSNDDATHVAVIDGTGKETRGPGSAKALVTVRLEQESSDRTLVDVGTELTITGKAAQFGGGVMQDVAGRIIDQFAANLSALMGTTGAEAAAAGASSSVGDGVAKPTPPLSVAPPAVPRFADSINLLSTASIPVLKRVVPIVVGALVIIGVVWWLIKR